jgi:phenylacetate-CoA ligase
MKPYLLRRLILPAWQRAKGQNSLELLPYLEKTQWLTVHELAALQWKRAAALLEHAYQHVPYYRDIMRDGRIDPESIVRDRSLEALPLLDRFTITEQRDRFRATNLPTERFVPNGTGGSTGEPLLFFDDRNEAGWSEAAVWRSHGWYDVDVGDRCAYLWGANFDLTGYQGFSGRIKSRVLNLLMLPAWELSESTASLFWKQLCQFKPRLLVAYAGALHQWARLLGDNRDPIPGLSAIIVSAEMLYDETRQAIEACFKVPVYNRYGGRDLHFVAQECRAQKGLHINSENLLVEIVKDGRQVAPGELGEIVITRLDNFVMPFVRYRSGDLGVLNSAACECGRSLPLLQKIEGRVQDAIVTAEGRIISGPFFAHVMKDCPDVREFQVHQLAINRLLLMVVLQGGRQFVSRPRIERIAQQYMGRNMQIEFDVRDSIPLTRTGKRRVIVSHLNATAA